MPEALGRTDMRDVKTKMRDGNIEMPRKVISGGNVGGYSVCSSEQNADSGETGGGGLTEVLSNNSRNQPHHRIRRPLENFPHRRASVCEGE